MASTSVEKLIRSYPRARPELPNCYQEIYEREYLENREGRNMAVSAAQNLERWMHRHVASTAGGQKTLELGAGTLNHLNFEDVKGAYDIVEPAEFLYKNNKNLRTVRFIFSDISEIQFCENYDRIISIAVLEHLTRLPFVLARCGLLLAENGLVQAGIPCEGELAWYLGWRCFTGVSYYFRNKLDYGILMRHEHVNKAREITEIMSFLFEDVKIKRYPIPIKHMSFYMYIEAKYPKREICRQLIRAEEI